MRKEVFITEDGSHSISIPALNASYHSTHGALQESMHIFMEAGLKWLLAGARFGNLAEAALSNIREKSRPPGTGSGNLAEAGDPSPGVGNERNYLSVLEIGLGTGLNVLLTLQETEKLPVTVYYEAIEADPVEPEIAGRLNYAALLPGEETRQQFLQIHLGPWNDPYSLSGRFLLHKRLSYLQDAALTRSFNLIYFDVFAPEVQPELWTEDIFRKLYAALAPGGALLTYCSKSTVRHALAAAGFMVEKLPGPKGKREIVRAGKAFN